MFDRAGLKVRQLPCRQKCRSLRNWTGGLLECGFSAFLSAFLCNGYRVTPGHLQVDSAFQPGPLTVCATVVAGQGQLATIQQHHLLSRRAPSHPLAGWEPCVCCVRLLRASWEVHWPCPAAHSAQGLLYAAWTLDLPAWNRDWRVWMKTRGKWCSRAWLAGWAAPVKSQLRRRAVLPSRGTRDRRGRALHTALLEFCLQVHAALIF